jgi:biotin carboxyl carrier protein
MKYLVQIKSKSYEVQIAERDGQVLVSLDGQPVQVDCAQFGGKSFASFLFNHRSLDLEFSRNGEKVSVSVNGKRYECILEDERTGRLKRLGVLKIDTKRENLLKSPMPGLVTGIEVKEGDLVVAGQGVVIVEAMKMENELKAPHDGKVKEIKVKQHQAVDKDQVLMIFE